MPLIPMGNVRVVPGTPQRVVVLGNTDPTYKVHGVLIQAFWDNVGKVFVGDRTLNKVARTGIHGTLAVPTTNSIPSFTAALTASPNAINLTDLWIDGDNLNEGVTVSVLIA